MKTKRSERLLLALGLVTVTVTVTRPARADGPTGDDRQKVIDREIQESLRRYTFSSDPDSRTALTPHLVLRWVNDPRLLQQGGGTLVLWTGGGRPEAVASIYPWNGHLAHEFVSLSRAGGVHATDRGRPLWSPRGPGVTFRDVPDAPSPADTPARRLAQMKALAERFKARMTGWKADDSDRAELRLLPRPIYRYDLKDAPPAPTGLEDGAAFAFVLGTDPEAILLLEAVRVGEGTRWQYAFARATFAGVEARLGPEVVWGAPKMPSQPNPGLSMFAFGRALPE